jgi:hypothetical protein
MHTWIIVLTATLWIAGAGTAKSESANSRRSTLNSAPAFAAKNKAQNGQTRRREATHGERQWPILTTHRSELILGVGN